MVEDIDACPPRSKKEIMVQALGILGQRLFLECTINAISNISIEMSMRK